MIHIWCTSNYMTIKHNKYNSFAPRWDITLISCKAQSHCVLVAAAVFAAAFSFHINSLEYAEADTQILPRSNTTKFILVLGKISHFFLYVYSIFVPIEDDFCNFGIFGQIWLIYYVQHFEI